MCVFVSFHVGTLSTAVGLSRVLLGLCFFFWVSRADFSSDACLDVGLDPPPKCCAFRHWCMHEPALHARWNQARRTKVLGRSAQSPLLVDPHPSYLSVASKSLCIRFDSRGHVVTDLPYPYSGRQVPPKAKPAWDSNIITPGTEFMHKLSRYLRFYVQDRVNRDKAWQNIKVRT